MDRFQRNIQLFGEEKCRLLGTKTVLVAGLGGVGGYAVEALARLGFGKLVLIDFDTVDTSNINRQIIALDSTIGCKKTELFKTRIKEINPCCEVITYNSFINKDSLEFFEEHKIDYIVDAIDTLESKILLIKKAQELNIPIVSCMGMANRIDATKIIETTLNKTEYDPVAKKIRYLCRKENIDLKNIKVVCSKEEPFTEVDKVLPSCVIVPSVAGIICAQVVLKEIFNQ